MRPPETYPHGTRLVYVSGGYRITRPDRTSLGRIAVSIRRDRSWHARCEAWDGYTWTIDVILARPTLMELEQAVKDYVARVDNHVHACGLPN